MFAACKCLHFVYSNIKLYYWTDSADSVYWINSYHKVWKNFVQKQVTQIRSNLPDTKWLHCAGTANPADIPSRGLSLNRKNLFNIWINGPQFPYYDEPEWGKFISCSNTREKPINLRSNKSDISSLTNVHLKSVRDLKEVLNLKKYNNFDKLIRVTCFVYRFIFNCKKKIDKEKHLRIGCLKNEEIDFSQVLWLINEQRNITNNSKIMTDLRGNLTVFIDDNGILRVKGTALFLQVSNFIKQR